MNNTEIKFRVWDKVKKEFIKHKSIRMDIDGSFIEFDYWLDGKYYQEERYIPEEAELQRYTGLKINDQEVYEGDLIETKRVLLIKEYDRNDYYLKGPFTLSNPHETIKCGKVVFDRINDIDDFYCPYMLGWGILFDDGTISSLIDKIELHSCPLRDEPRIKEIELSIKIIGNINEKHSKCK